MAEEHRATGQLAHGLLVSQEGVEGHRDVSQQRVGAALVGEGDGDGADRLAVRPVDHPTEQPAQRADAVAAAEEGHVGLDGPLGQRAQLGLGAALLRRLGVLGVGDVEGAAAQDDPGERVEVELLRGSPHRLGQRLALEPHPSYVGGREPGEAQDRVELALRDVVLGTDAEEQEGLHLAIMTGPSCAGRLRPGPRPRAR